MRLDPMPLNYTQPPVPLTYADISGRVVFSLHNQDQAPIQGRARITLYLAPPHTDLWSFKCT